MTIKQYNTVKLIMVSYTHRGHYLYIYVSVYRYVAKKIALTYTAEIIINTE